MSDKQEYKMIIGGRTYRLPNALAVVILTGLTGLCYLFIDDPQYATFATMALAALGIAAKALAINFGEIVNLFDNTGEIDGSQDKIPLPSSAAMRFNKGELQGKQAEITTKGKLARWLTD